VKDYPKPPPVSDCISQGKMILQGGFMAKIGAHKSKASNLLKLKCKMNNELVCCLFNSQVTNSFMTLQMGNHKSSKNNWSMTFLVGGIFSKVNCPMGHQSCLLIKRMASWGCALTIVVKAKEFFRPVLMNYNFGIKNQT
jgi:hypothetical protein